jgi:DNA (cytosine-5)-methyltransferase 1
MNMIKVVELFAGIGSQSKALKNKNIDHEIVAISEWSVNSVMSYAQVHCEPDDNTYDDMTKEDLLRSLSDFTYSIDTKNPDPLHRMKVDKLRKLWSAHNRSKNLGSIKDVFGDAIPDHDMMTYSVPCQDLSLQGHKRGLTEGKSSSLLWEVGRIIEEMGERRPRVLVMENVTAILAPRYKKGFDRWCDFLTDNGYYNYIMKLNATDYGHPQNRLRCFMVSSLTPMDDLVDAVVSKGQKTTFGIKDILDENPASKLFQPKIMPFLKEDAEFKVNKSGIIYTNLTEYSNFNSEMRLHDVKGYSSSLSAIGPFSRIKILDKGQIRILSPREYWKLQGFTDTDFDKVEGLHIDTEMRKQAGNSMARGVLEVLFEELDKRM